MKFVHYAQKQIIKDADSILANLGGLDLDT
jgi:hypothetical protein